MEATITVKEIINEMLTRANFEFSEISIQKDGDNNFRFAVQSKDSGLLIGSDGKNIKALNQIVKQIAQNNKDEKVREMKFFVDINNYQLKNIERLKKLAQETAEKVIFFKRDIEMEPMTAFDRMIVHSAIGDNPNISTESEGEGFFRKVCVKYKGF